MSKRKILVVITLGLSLILATTLGWKGSDFYALLDPLSIVVLLSHLVLLFANKSFFEATAKTGFYLSYLLIALYILFSVHHLDPDHLERVYRTRFSGMRDFIKNDLIFNVAFSISMISGLLFMVISGLLWLKLLVYSGINLIWCILDQGSKS